MVSEVVQGTSEVTEEGDEGSPSVKVIPPEDQFLKVDGDGFWELGPLPAGSVLRVDLANAMHTYATQKWSKYWINEARSLTEIH